MSAAKARFNAPGLFDAVNLEDLKRERHAMPSARATPMPSQLRLDPRTVIDARRQKRTRFTPVYKCGVSKLETPTLCQKGMKTAAKPKIQITTIRDTTHIYHIQYNTI